MLDDFPYYGFDGQRITREDSYLLFSEPHRRRVAWDSKGGVVVSTVLLTIDHGFGRGKPVIFETMIFGGREDQWQERDVNKVGALMTHLEACKLAFDPWWKRLNAWLNDQVAAEDLYGGCA